MKRKNHMVEFYNFPESSIPLLKRSAGAVLKAENCCSACEISIVMISDAEIRKLNRRYRHVDRITDVISFCFTKKPLCGDIYIARGRSKKQAKGVGNNWEGELSYLVMHGILHLFDYTDYEPAQKKKMFALQDELFKKISGKK